METRIFDSFDPQTGITRWFHYDHATDEFHIETEQNVTDLVEINTEISKEDTGRFADGMHRVASIPMTIYMQLKAEGILEDKDRLRRWLNERDNRVFRTRLGQV